ncbi:hypothetical protein BKA67DRAFT_580662 [Truncatella angustata]|uniref:Uncharacterized protein n=1 Tax=Truncatella angustata TaxID=152316 RepID=A0A9P8RIT2_9PEZI|nr:uncharacterized protein BKA67DRAFT_580662 [Truncatella angustata]KAH6646823.1 hypothetical protein BKA67DRAFT_580662 [Truncatella angustata]
MPQSLRNSFQSFRISAPEFCVLFWVWLEYEFVVIDNEDAAKAMLEKLGSIDSLLASLKDWDWALRSKDGKLAHKLQGIAEEVQAFWNIAHPAVPQNLGIHLPNQIGHPLLWSLLGRQKATELTIEDPEEPGQIVNGQIIGRNSKKSAWFGLVLPSRKKPGCWRGYWIASKRHQQAYMDYVKTATLTLSIAGDSDFLDECQPEDFQIIAVFQMKWGKTYHTHALGVPYYDQSRVPMLYSKSILASGWGKKDTERVLGGHMRNAGQTNYLATEYHALDRVSAKAW